MTPPRPARTQPPRRRPTGRRLTAAMAGAAVALAGPIAVLPTASAQPAGPTENSQAEPANEDGVLNDLIISEYIEGTSNNKAIELYNGTQAEIDLADYRLLQYNNAATSPTNTISLVGDLGPGEVHVVTHTQWALDFEPDQRAGGLNFNGNDALVLQRGSTIVDSFGRVGEDPGAPGWGDPPVTMDRTLVRLPDVCAGDTLVDDEFDPHAEYEVFPVNTITDLGSHATTCEPGEGPVDPDPDPPVGECGDETTAIGAVQGTESAPAMLGDVVSVEGVVTSLFTAPEANNGFFVQDEGDDDPLTSDGIFVLTGAEVAVGDHVRVTGLVENTAGLGRINTATDDAVSVCESGLDLPDPVELELPLSDQEQWSHESMHVAFPEDLTILEYFNYARFGEMALGTDRQYQPTHLFEPGSDEAVAELEANLANRITLDDGSGFQNPSFLRHPDGTAFTLENTFRGGDLVTGVTGVLDYRFNLWRIQPTAPAVHTVVNERPLDVPDVGGDTTIVAFNVLNYFTTFGSRGAENQEEFDRQEAKIVSALAEIDGDIVGLIEIENNDDVAVAALTDALNEELGSEVYSYLATGDVGTDAITTALIYKHDEVTPVGDFALLDESVDERFLDHRNRPVLTQTFQRLVDGEPAGEPITVANNHLKSKGSGCESDGDPEDPNGQANCNGVRTQAAEAMVDWLATDPTDSGADNVVIIGDLNSYAQEDPIAALADGGYVDLLWDNVGPDVYTYVFDGQLGYLDYALASADANELVTGAASWYINTDEPAVLDYTTRFKPPSQQELWEDNPFRSSDHDPVIVGLALGEETDPVDPVEPAVRISGGTRFDTAAEVAKEIGPSDVVYLGGSTDFPDVLAAGAPAARDGSPILITRPGTLHPAAARALIDAEPSTVYVVGGSAVVSDEVLADVRELTGAEVTRLAGPNRYATAAEIARQRYVADDVETVYVASGLDFADALASAPLAGAESSPLLLTRGGALPPETTEVLSDLSPERIVIVGGEGRVSDDVLLELREYAPSVTRLAGADRFETAARIAAQLPASDRVVVVNAFGFADAAAAAPLAGHLDAPVLVTRPEELPLPTESAIVARSPEQAVVLGGTGVVADAVVTQIEAIITGG